MPTKDERLDELTIALQTLLGHIQNIHQRPIPREALQNAQTVLNAERTHQSRTPRAPAKPKVEKSADTNQPENTEED